MQIRFVLETRVNVLSRYDEHRERTREKQPIAMVKLGEWEISKSEQKSSFKSLNRDFRNIRLIRSSLSSIGVIAYLEIVNPEI